MYITTFLLLRSNEIKGRKKAEDKSATDPPEVQRNGIGIYIHPVATLVPLLE